ncbi:hypothetical protein J3Q64DRAFT_1708787 [Phycomyces blakesleeanus]|uniref:Transmembrane protein n=1 Tax=Phycomyces blakesleeanus TaxID=4837 RepID=A0ABR3BES3_PHYBL
MDQREKEIEIERQKVRGPAQRMNFFFSRSDFYNFLCFIMILIIPFSSLFSKVHLVQCVRVCACAFKVTKKRPYFFLTCLFLYLISLGVLERVYTFRLHCYKI